MPQHPTPPSPDTRLTRRLLAERGLRAPLATPAAPAAEAGLEQRVAALVEEYREKARGSEMGCSIFDRTEEPLYREFADRLARLLPPAAAGAEPQAMPPNWPFFQRPRQTPALYDDGRLKGALESVLYDLAVVMQRARGGGVSIADAAIARWHADVDTVLAHWESPPLAPADAGREGDS